MGADNWSKCPRCLKQGIAVFENLERKVADLYGKVPVEEFDEQRVALAKEEEILQNDNTFRTFREDYEFYGAENGVVIASYSGQCSKCGLKLKFEDSHPIRGL